MRESKQTHDTDGKFKRYFYKYWDGSDWDYGRLDKKGYFHVYRPDYSKCNAQGMAKRAHIIWWLETKEIIQGGQEVVHHIDGDKSNDAFSNLQKMTHGGHTSLHWKGKSRLGQNAHLKTGRYFDCCVCGKSFHRPQYIINRKKTKDYYCSKACVYNRGQSVDRG